MASVVTSSSGFTSSKLGTPSLGIEVCSTLVPTAMISVIGSKVTVLDLTLRSSLPSTVITSVKIVRSPATPALMTRV